MEGDEGLVRVQVGPATLEAELKVPEGASGLVLFAHGSGSGRLSPRNQQVARELRAAGLGTLLLDLLTTEEQAEDMRTGRLRFDIELLAQRLEGATDWVRSRPQVAGSALGYYGASTGAAAALMAAARKPDQVRAIVSRGGRPDLAMQYLPRVKAPTLLIVGGDDRVVLALNQAALSHLPAGSRLEVIPGAGHLFEEPGALEQVSQLARQWFLQHLPAGSRPGSPFASGGQA